MSLAVFALAFFLGGFVGCLVMALAAAAHEDDGREAAYRAGLREGAMRSYREQN